MAAEVLLIVLLGALAWHSQRADRVDRVVASALYARPGTAVRAVADVVTFFGSAPFIVPATAVVAVWAWRVFRRDRALVGFAPVAVALTFVANQVLKRVVGRRRPSTTTLLGELHLSFPSGHATSAVSLALSMALLVVAAGLGGWRLWALGAFACAVAVSRLVVGAHYLTDILGGAALGGAGVLAVAWWFSGGGGRESNPPDGDRPSHPL